ITNARTRLSKLATHCDTLITIPNDQLLKVSPSNITLRQAFAYADDVLRQGIMGITQLLSGTGDINVDFSHIRHMMANGGGSLLSIGYGKGEDKVSTALYQALNHPLLEHLPIENATGIIANFTGGEDLSFGEVMEGLTHLQQFAGNNAEIIPGQIVDPNMKDEVQIILIITGIASTPLNAEAAAQSSRNAERVSPAGGVYREEPAARYTVADEPKAEPELEMAYSVPEVTVRTASNADRLTPSEPIDTPAYQPSEEANAVFETIMRPFGLDGMDASSRRIPEKRGTAEADDLDKPTFLRRRL
ncbi:MAG: hypothetical protein IKP86_02455, partial [Anaerolineaceae bacterium]|nr:hypothetical protein [Anaerolineaceae bacterium]